MGDNGPTDQVLMGDSRHALLVAVRDAGRPLDAVEAGARVGLRPNTARGHLDLLCSMRLLKRQRDANTRRGRPRVLYELAAPTKGHADIRFLQADETDGAGLRGPTQPMEESFIEPPVVPYEAQRAARRWVATLAPAAPSGACRAEQALFVMTEVLERLGFHPDGDPKESTLAVHDCPFGEVARHSHTRVCEAHLVMLEAVAEQFDTTYGVELEYFAFDDVSHCLLRLTRRPAAARAQDGAMTPDEP